MSVKQREEWIRCFGFSKEACLHRRGCHFGQNYPLENTFKIVWQSPAAIYAYLWVFSCKGRAITSPKDFSYHSDEYNHRQSGEWKFISLVEVWTFSNCVQSLDLSSWGTYKKQKVVNLTSSSPKLSWCQNNGNTWGIASEVIEHGINLGFFSPHHIIFSVYPISHL